MKMMNHSKLLLIIFAILMSIVSSEAQENNDNQVPVALVSSQRFEAPPVIEGEDITHEFIVKNTGTATLKISRVKTG
jgi:hypothetical protein